ncbi:MAG: MaoC family dehydratase, partial [Rhodospirillales bacterium]|nr:MaoC family dehydratase [Rhodospirillales bacterium]
MLVHGEQKLVIHKPLSAEGRVETSTRVIQILDKGADKGAIMYRERKMTCGITGDALATLGESFFLRGSGGFGGQPGPTPPAHTLPEREPEESLDIATLPQAALIYRLSGDYNPLHAEPAFAARAGFDKPILHGLCSFGVTCRAVLKTYCGGVPERLKSIQVRFSAPVFPGETIRTEMWRDGSEVSFRARVVGRGVLVINNGKAEIAD